MLTVDLKKTPVRLVLAASCYREFLRLLVPSGGQAGSVQAWTMCPLDPRATSGCLLALVWESSKSGSSAASEGPRDGIKKDGENHLGLFSRLTHGYFSPYSKTRNPDV